MIDSVFTLLGGLALAGAGGELFVRGLVGLARWARVPASILAVSIAAFATSSPELSVSVNAAIAGTPQIGLGDALGSNIVNVGLILGIALLLGELRAPRDTLRRDFPLALLVPVGTGILLIDGVLSRFDGVVLLVTFAAWLTFVVRHASRSRSAADVLAEKRHWLASLMSAAGLGMLVLSGRLIVSGSTAIGEALGLAPFVIGATMVAVGTSIPELATTVISRLRGHEEIGLGTVLGSNLFNGCLIVGTAAVIHPIAIDWRMAAGGLGFGVALVAAMYPRADGRIPRMRGVVLLLAYVGYVVLTVTRGDGG